MTSPKKPKPPGRYAQIMDRIFKNHYRKGSNGFEFDREEFIDVADELKIKLPKNLGDVIYSFRYRQSLPNSVVATAPQGKQWIITGVGIGKYSMRLIPVTNIEPRPDLLPIKIPDATPEIIARYALDDEQALLAKVRYNRLVDVFLGVVASSLQNHLRTAVKEIGQIEIDEIYVAVDRSGVHYVVPVQAKGGNDKHSVVQTMQDIAWCEQRFPDLVCRAVSAQFLADDLIAMFELVSDGETIRVARESHYLLVPAEEISSQDLKGYRQRATGP